MQPPPNELITAWVSFLSAVVIGVGIVAGAAVKAYLSVKQQLEDHKTLVAGQIGTMTGATQALSDRVGAKSQHIIEQGKTIASVAQAMPTTTILPTSVATSIGDVPTMQPMTINLHTGGPGATGTLPTSGEPPFEDEDASDKSQNS